VSKDQEAEQSKSASRNWQDLAKQYRTIGIAAVAAAVEIIEANEPKPVRRKVVVRYLGNSAT